MADSKASALLIKDDPSYADRLLPWNALPEHIDTARIRNLRVFPPGDATLGNLPECLRKLVHLTELQLGPTIDVKMIRSIEPGSMPPNLKVLRIYGDRTSSVVWPKEVRLPHLEELRTDFSLKFERENFPDLKIIANKLGGDESFLDVLDTYENIIELDLFTVNSNDIFLRLGRLPIHTLGLLGGSITSLDGIGEMGALTSLTLNNTRHLKNISGIASLAGLTEVNMLWCRHVADIETILALKKLRKVRLFSCGDIGFEKIRERLASIPDIELKISSTT